MSNLLGHPAIFSIICFIITSSGAWGSILFLRQKKKLNNDAQKDFDIVQTVTLSLLALLIGFSFSMAVNRYDLRKNYEEEEANAIGTEYLRADLAAGDNTQHIRTLLKAYLDLRVDYYQAHDFTKLHQINAATSALQSQLWQAILIDAKAQPNPVIALLVSGMNDVINTQGYTQAAWRNRIPVSAWGMMIVISLFCSILTGYSAHSSTSKGPFLFILPLMISLSLGLIADIDSPRGGLIHVVPQNLLSLQQSMGQSG